MQIIDKNQSLEIQPTLAEPPHPWIRFFARYIDLYLFTLVFSFTLGAVLAWKNPKLLNQIMHLHFGTAYGMAMLFLWIFGESLCLWLFKTTPGKSILNIKIEKNDGEPILFSEAIGRSAGVCIAGLGAGIPLITLFTQIYSYKHLKKYGRIDWDEQSKFNITHRKIGFLRGLIAFLIMVGFLLLSIYLSYSNNPT